MSRPAIAWDAANTQRLIDACRRVPTPSDDALAAEFGVTVKAIQTARCASGISALSKRVVDGQQRERKCGCCGRPFVSRHHGNRLCDRCRKRAA